MKTIIIFFCVFILITMVVQADVYVKGILHVEGGYRSGHIVPEINAVNEWWFDRDKVTFISTGWQLEIMNTDWRFTLDKEKKRILVINLTNATFVDVSLQKNQVSYLDPSYIEVLSDLRFNGTVEKLKEKETYLEKTCDTYRVNEWMMEVDLRFYERERTILVTPDVPFNWQLFDELFHWIRSFFNPISLLLPSTTTSIKDVTKHISKISTSKWITSTSTKWITSTFSIAIIIIIGFLSIALYS